MIDASANDMDCRIFVDADMSRQKFLLLLATSVGVKAEAIASVVTDDSELIVDESDDFDEKQRRDFPDGFLHFRFGVEVYRAKNVTRKESVLFVSRLLQQLWSQGLPAVAGCDYEADLPHQGGYKSRSVPWPDACLAEQQKLPRPRVNGEACPEWKAFPWPDPKPAMPLETIDHETLARMMEEHRLHVSTLGKEGREAELSHLYIVGFDFSGLDLSDIHAQGALFVNCRFADANLSGVDFGNASAPGCDFRGAHLGKAEFYESDLSRACFDGANLLRTIFMKSSLLGATFRGAAMPVTSFDGCDITGAIFDSVGLDLPKYYAVNSRLVKLVRTPDGEMDVLAYDWDTGEFVRALTYLPQVLFPGFTPGKDVDDLSEAEFEARQEELQER